MPSPVDFHFQSSLRGTANNKSPAVKLHRGCSGTLHGHGVDKVKSKVVPAPCQRERSCQQYSAGYDHHYHNGSKQNETFESEDSDAESPMRRKSMLGLGHVLPPAESKGLPPRSPPKFLTYSTRSLSSSTCSSSSSSRYSSSPSPGIQDQFNSPLMWPSAAASAGFYLEEVSEEGDGDLDSADWAGRTSPSCSTLTSPNNSFGANSLTDQGRRQRPQPPSAPPPRHHSTPSRPYTERNRASDAANKATVTVKRAIINSGSGSSAKNNNNNKSPPSPVTKSSSQKPLNSSVKRSNSDSSKSSTINVSSRTLTRQISPPSVSSTPRSSISSTRTERTVKSIGSNKSSTSSNNGVTARPKKPSPAVNGTRKSSAGPKKEVARGTPVTQPADEVVVLFFLPIFPPQSIHPSCC